MNNYNFSTSTVHSFMTKSFWIFLLSTSLLFSCDQAQQQQQEIEKTPAITFDQIVSDEPINLTIVADTEIMFDKINERDYQTALGRLDNGQGIVLHEGEVKVKSRGKSRKEMCEIPPVMFKIGEGATKLKLKLVTPCQLNQEGQSLLYKEQLAYEMYHKLTEYSFRTQLVNITYKDNDQDNDPLTMVGFFIEDDEQISTRLSAQMLRAHEEVTSLNQEQQQLMTMYQYFIGNTDWDLDERHNIKMVRKKGSNVAVAIPYDFDKAGLVDAPYAIPNPKYPVETVKNRHFMGKETSRAQIEPTIQIFEDKKAQLKFIIDNATNLAQEDKLEVTKFIDKFYGTLSDQNGGIINIGTN